LGQAYSRSDITKLKSAKIADDTSYVYSLPFEKGTRQRIIQGAISKFSHKDEIALDFNCKTGTIICAARGGVVVGARNDSNNGGYKSEYLNEGNYIIIKHNDDSQAMYWHLQYNGTLVKEGDTVLVGQPIGLSGNTGYSAFPHLHFEVHARRNDGSFGQVPVRFHTKKGIKYLRPLKKYRVV
jgi:murein DD-endopeptidase MepM/ murein hydrolase activator NlpD